MGVAGASARHRSPLAPSLAVAFPPLIIRTSPPPMAAGPREPPSLVTAVSCASTTGVAPDAGPRGPRIGALAPPTGLLKPRVAPPPYGSIRGARCTSESPPFAARPRTPAAPQETTLPRLAAAAACARLPPQEGPRGASPRLVGVAPPPAPCVGPAACPLARP